MAANRDIPMEHGEKILAEAITQENGCRFTIVPGNPTNEYAYYKGFLAHRAVWVFVNGRQIRPRYVIDHLCFNRLCVNPEHLREITRRENSMRKTGDAWALGTCKWGHPDSDRVTVYWKSRKERTECATCRKETNDIMTITAKYLRRLELAYCIRLTRAQQAMVDEFMPQYEKKAA
jgi:hypothetical protein